MNDSSVVTHVRSFYDRDLLTRAFPHLCHALYGQVRDIPQNAGEAIIFRRYEKLATATTALTEGVTPAGSTVDPTDITATVLQFGDFLPLTDWVELTVEDPVIMEFNKLLGEQAGESIDEIVRDVLVTGSTVQYASSATSRVTVTSAMTLDVDEVKEAVLTLQLANARKIMEMVTAGPNIDTTPIAPCYVGILHPRVHRYLKADADFVRVENYAQQGDRMPGEVGQMDEVRFVMTTNAKVFTAGGSGGIDVYATLILGRDAYGMTRISGAALQTITKPIGSDGASDPLNQRGSHGWKATMITKILNDNFMVRIEHA